MEPLELSPALLQPQDTMVAILGELLATLPSLDETLSVSLRCLYLDLVKFTRDLRATLYRTDDTWWHRDVTTDDDDPPTSRSQALAAYESTPFNMQKDMIWRDFIRQWSVHALVNSWAELARAASKLRDTCRDLATKAATEAANATARARELQEKAARYGTAQENMGELGQALGREEGAEVVARREAQVRREARVAASEARRATMERQWVEAALGLLERLVAACEEATAFPRELQRLLRETKATLEGTNEASPDVPKDVVNKLAMAERLWEANARQATRHLVGTLPDTIKFLFTGDPTSPSVCGVAERCQRAIEDIPRLLRPPECPQSVPKVSPVSMEVQELIPALLQPQITVVAILGELLATLPSQDEMILLSYAGRLCKDLEDITKDLRVTLYCTDDTWWHSNVTSDDDDDAPTSDDDEPLVCLSRALAAWENTPWTPQNHVTREASKWQRSLAVLVDSWAKLATTATHLYEICSWMATEAADMVATAQAWELQAVAARYGTAQENMVELGQDLGREEGAKVVAGHGAQVRRDARVAASWARRATMVRQRVEAALGLLERLVAACDEASAFPRELQWRLRDTKAALKGTNVASPDIPKDLVAKVAECEQLWEANARLVKDHLLRAVDDIIKFYFDGGPISPSACEVAERCQRAIEDIPRLLRPLDHLQDVPRVSPVSMELQELSLALLQPQVTVVAILGELLGTLRSQAKMKVVSALRLYWDLVDFTKDLWVTLYCTDDTWWRRNVTSDDDDPVTSLSQALTAFKGILWTRWNHVTMVASKWQGSVAALVNRWAQMVRKATKLRNTRRRVATEEVDRAASATAWARELQAKAARFGTAQENMVELGQDLGREEGAKVVAGHEARVRRDARVAASEATRATVERQRVETALGLLERLVAACDEASAFPRELQRRVGDIEATLKGTNAASPDVPEDLVAKVAMAEQLWEANTRLAKDHLLGTLQDTIKFLFTGGPANLSEVAERCQRAIEDIPRLVRPQEGPQGVPNVSPVGMELQEVQRLSPNLLQPQVAVVSILGELLATLTSLDKMILLESPGCLYKDLDEFTNELWETMECIKGIWWRVDITLNWDFSLISLKQALAAYKSTPWTTWDDVTEEALKWQWVMATRVATEATNTVARARELQYKVNHYWTAQENMVELGQALGREEAAEVVAGHGAQVRREARVAASEARRATMERQRVEAALGLLERLVAACDEATAFPRELQRRIGDIKAALEGTNEASPDVPEALVAQVAVAEQMWEANARLAKDHLTGTLKDIKDYFNGGSASSSACGVAEQCQRAIEDIPRFLQCPKRPQSVPKVSPLSMELQKLSLAVLQPQVTVVAILGELLATLPSQAKMMLPVSMASLCWDLVVFTEKLRVTLYCTDDAWWHCNVTSDDDGPVTSLSQALTAYRSTPWTTRNHVTMVACDWQGLVAVLVGRWAQLARKATKLRDTCRDLATEAADRAATTTTRARELQDETAHYGTAQENMVELGQALSREEGAEVVAGHGAQVRREARVAASEATRATMVRQRVEAALGLLERLVAACDEATAFPRELQRLLRDIEATLKGTNTASPDVPEDLVAKVAMAEWLWEANARLAKDHLLGTLPDTIKFLFNGGPASPSACVFAKRCQRAIEDIPRLIRPLEHPQSVPKVSAVSTEPQKVSPPQLQTLVAVVATLGEVVATVTGPHWGTCLRDSPDSLHKDLKNFTQSLCAILNHGGVTSLGHPGVPSLRRALATLWATPGTLWADVRAAAKAWQKLVARLVDSWDWLAREATKLCDIWGKVVPDQQLMVALGKEVMALEMATHNAQVAAVTSEAMGEPVAATRRGHWAEVALGLLQRLVATCDRATLFYWNMEWWLRDMKAILKGTNEVSPDVLQALVAKVAKFEWLWEASTRLAKDHLLGTLGVIDNILLSPYGGWGGPGGPGSCTVAKQCQKAIEDIPRLLQESFTWEH
ncbi:uncharacterized protein LOC132085556 [Ammospiza nelsoni]|uniref:uncharacterized protein LOC132085556 n=1 Tax=Ammospiza nelsoni TaxID=2857394 RepID=UPI00286A633B|nr:uncharacterized protein LOC132085556 [Ammospiza nelsoni]